MSIATQIVPHSVPLVEDELLADLDDLELPETDGMPLDSAWHRDNINLLVDSLSNHWKDRHDFFAGGNMCVYYSTEQARQRNFLGPDVFVVNGNVNFDKQRRIWCIWEEEGRGLDVVIELMSRSTAKHDVTHKKDLYEQRLRIPEYFVYDPDTQQLRGWRLNSQHVYDVIVPAENGRLWSEQTGLWLGKYDGFYQRRPNIWLRWFDSDGNLCLLNNEEAHMRADAEMQRADAEMQRANAEAQRADLEAKRAAELEAELNQLRHQLAQRQLPPE